MVDTLYCHQIGDDCTQSLDSCMDVCNAHCPFSSSSSSPLHHVHRSSSGTGFPAVCGHRLYHVHSSGHLSLFQEVRIHTYGTVYVYSLA